MKNSNVKVEIVEVKKSVRHPGRRPYDYRRRDYTDGMRIFTWIEKYNPITDIFSGERYNKPHLQVRKQLAKVFEMAGLEMPADLKVRWDIHCGCAMCPCTPGFVANRSFYNEDGDKIDLHVTYRYIAEPALTLAEV